MWYCFYCQAIRSHKGDSCRNKDNAKDGFVKRSKSSRIENIEQFRDKNGRTNEYNNFRFRDHQNNQSRMRGRGSRGRVNNFKPRAQFVSGNNFNITQIDTNRIIFLADSGATDHIIHKAIILSNFTKNCGETIRSANKNQSANIKIDGRGDLILKSQMNENKSIKLRVIQGDGISENLISLRKFADLGLSIS